MRSSNKNLREMPFRLPVGCDFRRIVMRELDGNDEDQAAGMAEARGEKSYGEDLIALSVVSIDGKEVEQGFDARAMKLWKLKTRNAVAGWFQKLNSVSKEEVEDFSEGVEEAAAPSPPSTVTASGDGDIIHVG